MLNVDKFEKMLEAGLIARNAWRGKAPDGRETLCALAALSPAVAAAKTPSPAACPVGDCPPWLAELIPWLDDAPSEATWPGLMKRLGAVARALPGADPEALRRADYACRAIAVREARSHVGAEYAQALAAIDGVLVLLDRAALGEPIADGAWAAAAGAAAEAARAAGEAAGEAGEAAGEAARAAAGAARWARARAAASNRMADAMLTVLERAVATPSA